MRTQTRHKISCLFHSRQGMSTAVVWHSTTVRKPFRLVILRRGESPGRRCPMVSNRTVSTVQRKWCKIDHKSKRLAIKTKIEEISMKSQNPSKSSAPLITLIAHQKGVIGSIKTRGRHVFSPIIVHGARIIATLLKNIKSQLASIKQSSNHSRSS